MATIAQASLTPVERRALERAVHDLTEQLGPDLHAVWLYGSRARGEPPHDESDVDLLVVANHGDWRGEDRIARIVDSAVEAEGGKSAFFSTHVYSPERIEQRREIRSFFIQEVDRDKIVLYEEP